MKTKLDLYLAVQTSAQDSLNLAPKAATKALEELLTPLKLSAENTAFATQLSATGGR